MQSSIPRLFCQEPLTRTVSLLGHSGDGQAATSSAITLEKDHVREGSHPTLWQPFAPTAVGLINPRLRVLGPRRALKPAQSAPTSGGPQLHAMETTVGRNAGTGQHVPSCPEVLYATRILRPRARRCDVLEPGVGLLAASVSVTTALGFVRMVRLAGLSVMGRP